MFLVTLDFSVEDDDYGGLGMAHCFLTLCIPTLFCFFALKLEHSVTPIIQKSGYTSYSSACVQRQEGSQGMYNDMVHVCTL